ncbi:MAG: TetR/AcrR family transcriptional regulator [Planctomycetaceae bacterium]
MDVVSKKQQAIRAREGQILDLARKMLVEHGYLGLSMEAIAAELKCSKGTIYNHFPCKEEIIIALAIETLAKRTEMFQLAASRGGWPRERLARIGVAAERFVRLYPDHFRIEQLIRSNSIWEKTSVERQRVMHASVGRCLAIVSGIVRDGIAQGQLTLPDDLVPEDLVFGLWSQTLSADLTVTRDGFEAHGVCDPHHTLRQNINRLLDGYGWTPLSTEHDYIGFYERLLAETAPPGGSGIDA